MLGGIISKDISKDYARLFQKIWVERRMIRYDNAKLRMKIKLNMILVGYGSNGNRLRVWGTFDWMVCHSCNTPIFWVWATWNQWLWGRRKKLKQCHLHKTSYLPGPLTQPKLAKWLGQGKQFCCGLLGWLQEV